MNKVVFEGSEIDFEVKKVPFFFETPAGVKQPSKKISALVREDFNFELGYCGKRYTPIQNKTIFDFVTKVFESETEIEQIHSFEDGATNMLFSSLLPDLEFVLGNDKVNKRIFAAFNHTAGFSVRFGITEQVESCSNVFPSLLAQSSFRVTHDNLYNSKLDLGKELFKALREENAKMNALYQELSEMPVEQVDIEDMIKYSLEIPQKAVITELSTRTKNKIALIVDSVEKELASKGNTFWGLFNGMTYFANHVVNEQKQLTPEQQLYKLHYGSENYFMLRALSHAKRSVKSKLDLILE